MGLLAAAFVKRSLVVSFTLHVVLGAAVASAQTVILRHVRPGSTVDLVLDATLVGTAKADSEGTATVAPTTVEVPLDVNVWIDTCDDAHRVILARRAAQLIAAGACQRTQIAGLYFLQRVTSIVIDANATASLLIRQGQAPNTWLRDPPPVLAQTPAEPLPPLTGLTLFGAVGRNATLNFESQSCGDVTSCSDKAPTPYSGGLAWWFNDFIGAEARYGTLREHADGSSDAFRFTSIRDGGFLAFTGRGGFRLGRVRPFGRGGVSLHRATLTTTQTLNDRTIVTDGETQTVPGGTQILQMRTKGWAPVYGGGAEVWLSPFVGIYGEVQRIGLKGTDDRGSGIAIDDATITAQIGFTVRLP